jgi:dihydroceramidase
MLICSVDLLVGSGSFAFHSTLKCKASALQYWYFETNLSDPMQLVDELSMIYTACLMCYATFSFSQSKTVRRVLGTSLLSLAVFITVCY